METKHAPGPWIADGSESTTATWVSGPDGKHICSMRKCEQDWSNARLIAAAPELLEALQYALHVRGTTEDGPHVVAIIESAIAKATVE